MYTTYTTASGKTYDLTHLTAEEEAYLDRAVAAYTRNIAWAEFCQITFSAENPALVNGRLTRDRVDHPLFRAILDLEGRLGIRQGKLGAGSGSDLARDPFGDELLSITAAAALRGVTRETIYQAAERGDLVVLGERARPRVSRNSLDRLVISEARQRAGRRARASTARRA